LGNFADPKLRAALMPNYEFGGKRVLLSSDFYPALTRPDVFSAPFHATVLLYGARVIGRGGVSFADAFRQSRSAFLGVTARGFPNLFMLLGPNTGLGHNSVVLMIEAQIRYVMSCLVLMKRKDRPVMEVRESSQKRFGDFLRQVERA
jgi:cation diffusion facilitator CzcD-associated flavoprotein CzcO